MHRRSRRQHQAQDIPEPSHTALHARPHDNKMRGRRLLLPLWHGRHAQHAHLPLPQPHRLDFCGHGVHRSLAPQMRWPRHGRVGQPERRHVGARHQLHQRPIRALLRHRRVGTGQHQERRGRCHVRPPRRPVHRPRRHPHPRHTGREQLHRPVLHRGQRPQLPHLGQLCRNIHD